MEDILSILYQSILALPPTEEQKAVTRKMEPVHSRLNALVGEDAGDEIWGAAMEAGTADSADCFRRGFAMGFQLRAELAEFTR